MIKKLNKLGLERNCLNIIQAIYENPQLMLSGEKLRAFPLKSGTRDRYPLSSLFNIVWMSQPEQLGKKKKKVVSKLEMKKSNYLFANDMILNGEKKISHTHRLF